MEQTVQEVAGTGLSSDTIATLLGVAIGGFFAIGAAFAGQVAAYMLRRRGKVLCFVPPWTERRMRGNTVRYDLTLEFYNDRDVSIGITDIIFTHYKGDGSGEGWLSLMEDKE